MRGVLLGIIIAGTAVVSLLVGKLIGSQNPSTGGYPYFAIPAVALRSGSSRVYYILAAALIALMGFIGFAVGSHLIDPNFGRSTYYGTYSRNC